MTQQKQAAVFLAGTLTAADLPQAEREALQQAYRVAVDGGYRHLRRLKLRPQLLLGDFDSIEAEELAEAERSGVEILRWPVAKDFSDADLALAELQQRGYRTVRLYGALGGERFDHALANVWLLVLWKRKGLDIEMRSGKLSCRVLSEETADICGQPGDIVSLIPFSDRVEGVSVPGLLYPLHGETLYAGESRSISNALVGREAQVVCGRGMLLLMQYSS